MQKKAIQSTGWERGENKEPHLQAGCISEIGKLMW